ncbi:MAG: class I SAM-dependent methyltransferase, partial [Treponema sp.]|jgi:23S rRNA G2069 N7-methylase RlmK/C1962 C5-methylase RlmI|nr:class I SAM-dependent methyltransferase [Treponema sp.]
MTDATARALSIPVGRIFLKIRKRQRGASQYTRLVHQNFFVDVIEHGLVFRTNLSDYLDTGLFLDKRKLRLLIRQSATKVATKVAAKAPAKAAALAGAKRSCAQVLNLFCYTAAFSLYAATAEGWTEVDSVDISNTYLDWAKVNFALNGLQAEMLPQEAFFSPSSALPPFRLIRADALRFLNEAVKRGRTWDIIILDPPVFSNSKKMFSDFDLNRDYQGLIATCLSLLNPGGALYFSTNARRFTLAGEWLENRFTFRDITEQARDDDFRGKKVPGCWVFEDAPC